MRYKVGNLHLNIEPTQGVFTITSNTYTFFKCYYKHQIVAINNLERLNPIFTKNLGYLIGKSCNTNYLKLSIYKLMIDFHSLPNYHSALKEDLYTDTHQCDEIIEKLDEIFME